MTNKYLRPPTAFFRIQVLSYLTAYRNRVRCTTDVSEMDDKPDVDTYLYQATNNGPGTK